MFLVNVSYIVILLLAAYRDYKTYTVSRYTNLGIFLLSLMDITRFPLHLGGAFLITLPFLYIGVKKDQIGGGDIKFIFVNGKRPLVILDDQVLTGFREADWENTLL